MTITGWSEIIKGVKRDKKTSLIKISRDSHITCWACGYGLCTGLDVTTWNNNTNEYKVSTCIFPAVRLSSCLSKDMMRFCSAARPVIKTVNN